MSPCLLVVRSWLARRERALRVVALSVAVVVFAVQWVRSGLRLEDGDFYLHWQFARRFLSHELLYAEGLHVPYPPFWSAAWLPIAGLPLGAAKLICYPLSAVALALIVWLLDRLCRDRLPLSDTKRFWTIVAALAIVSRFLVRELPECGPNLMLLACVWSAIYLWTRGRDVTAGILLGFATALKCTPGLFIAYFAWKRQWRTMAAGLMAMAVFSISPALWQGPTDYLRHVQIWMANLRYGLQQADPSVGVLGPDALQNLSLRPAIVRYLMHLPAGHPGRLDHPAYVELLDLSPATAGRITKVILLAALVLVAWLFRKPIAHRDGLMVAWECAAVGALALLLSPITWYQHCVALLPVFYLFARTVAAGSRPQRWMLAVVAAFVLIVVVLSRGLIGRDAALLLASYHLTTLAIVGALVLAVGNRLALTTTRRQGNKETRRSWLEGDRRQALGVGDAQADVGTAPNAQSLTPIASGLRPLVSLSPGPPVTLLLETAKRLNWTAYFVALGIALRFYHYLRNPSLWHDEAALAVNVLEKSFVELLGPLRFSEAAPPLFLWLEKCVVLICGDSLFALRLLPFLASCAALVLFVPVARRLLGSAAAPWAVLLFAVSDRLLWHACEAKQYSLEVFAAVLLLFVWLTTENWPMCRRTLLFALAAPGLLCVAYPATFLYGGVLVALLGELLRSRRTGEWLAYSLLCLTVFATFGLLLMGPIHAQRNATIVDCWSSMSQFPDWTNPASVPLWIIRSTCDLVGYCIKPVGEWLTPLAIVGLFMVWQQGKRQRCLLLAVPIALALAASCLQAYPYGGMRVMSYAAPALFLAVAAAMPWCLERFTKRHDWATAIVAALLLVPVARAGYCVVRPWERADCAAAALYVKAHRRTGEIVTANHWEYLYYFRGLGQDFVPIENLSAPQDRMWVVVTGALPADRAPSLASFSAPQWATLDRQEFDRTTVVLVERQATAGSLARRP